MKTDYTVRCVDVRFSLIMMFALLLVSISPAQEIDFSNMESLTPRNIGPSAMSGRITTVDVVNSNPDIIYAGSASGGLWKSESGGISWEPIFDDNLALSIGAVAVSQKNPSIVWAGTGEGNPRNSLNGGYGVYRSLDAGQNWELMGLEETRNVHRIIIHPDDPNTVYIGAIGSPWGDHEQRGVYKTTDGGETWEKILYVDEGTGVGDMVMDPSNPNKLLVNMWQHRREPWFFTSGGPSTGLYMTIDGGKNWTKQTAEENGLPAGDLGRMGFAFATNNPNRVYAIIEAEQNALYRSEDGGFNWTMVNNSDDIGNRPFYYFDIYVDPQNENRVYSIFTNMHVSEDGGNTFNNLIPRGLIHVDNHALYINPANSNHMILGNDGGLAITRDMGKTWQFVETLPLGQFYHISVDNELPYNVYGGLQDNGSWTGPSYSWTRGGLRNDYYYSVAGGDGFDVVPDPDDSRYGYAMSQGGNVLRYDKETGRSKGIKPEHPDPDMRLRFNWNAAIAQDPFDNSTIYFGSQFVHKSMDKGSSWDIISPDLTTNDPEKQKQHLSGGLTNDATGAENFTTITAIEPSYSEPGVLWVGTDDGNVQISRDGGGSWDNVADNMRGVAEGSWVTQIRASKHNAGEVVVVINNYRRFDFKPYVMRTTNYGRSWESLASEDDVFGYALSFIQDPVEPNLMFLGTEHGLYITIDGAETWTKFQNGYPSVSTMDLAIQERESDLVIGTYGRAIWVLDDIQPLRILASNGQEVVAEASVTAIPARTAYMTSSRAANGPANPGSSTYEGENRQSGSAVIKFFAKKPPTPEQPEGGPNFAGGGPGGGGQFGNMSQEQRQAMMARMRQGGGGPGGAGGGRFGGGGPGQQGPQASIEISDLNGNVVRNLSTAVNDGLNQVNWRFDEDPLEGTEPPQLPAGIPAEFAARFMGGGGAPILPGTYNVKITVGDESDETQIEVKLDPRENVPMADLIARRDMIREVAALTNEITAMSNKVSGDIETVDKVIAALQGKSGREVMMLRNTTTTMKEEMDELSTLIGSSGFGGFGGLGGTDPADEIPLRTRVSTLSRGLNGSLDSPGRTQEMLMGQVETKMEEIQAKVDAWYAENWDSFLEQVSQIDFNPIDTE